MNEIISFGNYDNDRIGFGTCYDKFDYSNLTIKSINKINEIIGQFAVNTTVEYNKEKYLKMILYLAKIILSRENLGKDRIPIERLGTHTMTTLHKYISDLKEINDLR